MNDALRRLFGFVTDHNIAVLLVMVALSAGVIAGAAHLQMDSETNTAAAMGDDDLAQKLDYVQANFGGGNDSSESATSPAAMYVRAEGNALSKAALVDTLQYQQRVRENDSVAAALGGREVVGVANLVAARASGTVDPSLEDQLAALKAASPAEVEELVGRTLTDGSPALALLPKDYEAGSATAESHRMVFRFADADSRAAATAALYETASDRESPAYFTAGDHAADARNAMYMQNTMELIVPAALLLILAVLALSYRDLVDVVVGFTGVVLSVLWMFGILGWLRIPAGMSLIIGPVLIVGLSVDYGLHVFMRYREQRDAEEGIREPMARGLSSVAVALALVTLTAMVGFLSNATNDYAVIRQLAYAITLGVVSTFVISLTFVPALKVTIDGGLEWLGLDRRKRPLGKAGLLRPLLAGGARLARRGAPVVIVLALVAGSAGAVAWTDLDRQSVQQTNSDVAEWKQNLPGPLAWEVSEESDELGYVAAHYRAANEDRRTRSNVLIEGDVTEPAALAGVQSIHDAADGSDIVYQPGSTVAVTSPLTVMHDVAGSDESFRETFAAADTDDDGVPERNVAGVYDALFAAAPQAASQVIDRADGTYRALRVIVPVQPGTTVADQTDGMAAIANAAEGVDATAVGSATMVSSGLRQTAESILETLVIALTAVGILLTAVYRWVTGSASLGLVTAIPIVLVSALVIGGMWVFGVPLTLLTALLLSLVIGIGIDYNIHISDRFAQERERGRSVHGALVEATTGTGGALLGSTLTSAGAFSALVLHPHPQMQSFGTLVVLAMVTSFVVAVFVLPSMLTVWAHYGPSLGSAIESTPGGAAPSDD